MSFVSRFNHLLPRALRPIEVATARYIRWSGGVVQSGPFRGMRYIERAHCSQLAPKLAGTYEQELRPFLEQLVSDRPDVFIDIGAAEGYYAIGAALANWSPRIVAFESDGDARRGLTELMARNRIDPTHIELRGICTPSELNALLAEHARPAVIMDVEGFEALLLDPLRVPHLARARLLVEHHDFVLRGLREEICRRMSATHSITVIEQAPRRAEDLVCPKSVLRFFPAAVRRRVLSEQRPFSHHGWLWLTPLAKSATS